MLEHVNHGCFTRTVLGVVVDSNRYRGKRRSIETSKILGKRLVVVVVKKFVFNEGEINFAFCFAMERLSLPSV